MQQFPLNCWYMAAWSHELGDDQPLARRLLDLPVVFYRDEKGMAAALYDRCPHRFAPLSWGKIVEGVIQCGYHGLRFDASGKCVFNHHPGPIPPGARVRSFPIVEQDRILWFWPGDPMAADTGLIPRFPNHEDPGYDYIWGKSLVPAHFELITDNLLDLSHVTFLHPGFGGALFQPEFSMKQEGLTVTATFFTENTPNSAFGEVSFPAGGRNVDELDVMRWDMPASMLLDVYRNHTGKPPKEGGHNPSAHILTPETATSTHYFWGSGMPAGLKADQDLHRNFLTQAFETEDKPMMGAVQQAMEGAGFWDLHPALLSVDTAAVLARRLVRKQVRSEAAAVAEAEPAFMDDDI